METIRVRINADGVTAREWNPLGEKPPQKVKTSFSKIDNFYNSKMESKWDEAEAALRSFTISMSESWGVIKGFSGTGFFEPGTIHTASILPNGKIKILD